MGDALKDHFGRVRQAPRCQEVRTCFPRQGSVLFSHRCNVGTVFDLYSRGIGGRVAAPVASLIRALLFYGVTGYIATNPDATAVFLAPRILTRLRRLSGLPCVHAY